LLDLPPGTGDVAISLGQKLPNAQVIVVTTPQQAAAEVAERAGTMASMMNQRVIGVIENMAYLEVSCPDCGTSHRVDVFGSGGGENVAATLSTRLGYPVPLLGQVPLDPTLRASGDDGVPVTAGGGDSAAGAVLTEIAKGLAGRGRGLAGRQLGLAPTGR
jgi:ATP-binding protein involved in chromosome partitioning